MLVTSSCQTQTVFSIGFPAKSTLNGRSIVVIDQAYLDKQDVKAGCGPNMFDGLFKAIDPVIWYMSVHCLIFTLAITLVVSRYTKSYQSTMTALIVTSALCIASLAAMHRSIEKGPYES